MQMVPSELSSLLTMWTLCSIAINCQFQFLCGGFWISSSELIIIGSMIFTMKGQDKRYVGTPQHQVEWLGEKEWGSNISRAVKNGSGASSQVWY